MRYGDDMRHSLSVQNFTVSYMGSSGAKNTWCKQKAILPLWLLPLVIKAPYLWRWAREEAVFLCQMGGAGGLWVQEVTEL